MDIHYNNCVLFSAESVIIDLLAPAEEIGLPLPSLFSLFSECNSEWEYIEVGRQRLKLYGNQWQKFGDNPSTDTGDIAET